MSNTMLVFWTDYDRLKAQHDVADPKEEHPLDPDSDMMLEIHMKADNNTQDPIKFAVLHSGYNLFRDKRTFLPNSVSPDEFKTNLRFHTIQQFETAYMTPTTRVTKSLQDGIGGLFGRMDKNFHVDVSSIVDSSTSPQFARLIYNVPDTWEVHEEVLIMSIPEALASWGGVLSLAITIFNLTFGTRKISPVGFLQSRISRYSTIKKIEDEYSWDKKDQAAGGGGGGHQQGQGVPSSDSGSGSHHSRGKNVQNDNRPLSQVMGQGATMYSGNISHFEPEKRPLSQAFGPDTIIHVDNASQPEMGVPQPDSRSQMEYLIRRVKELENKVNMNESRASRFQEIVTDLYLDTSLIPQKFMDPLLRQHSTTNPHQAIGLTPTHTMDRQVSMAPQGTLNQPGMGMINSEVNTPVGTAQGPDTQAPQNRATRVQDWVHRFLKCNMGWPKN
ncbi:hypothetical protein BGX31_009980 [Mortierella sp. GBA43]|nr:hypothetical protein BGX31_009980 [Mortierella sp. GBA43]